MKQRMSFLGETATSVISNKHSMNNVVKAPSIKGKSNNLKPTSRKEFRKPGKTTRK
jgi:hypothetical protein